MSSSINAIVIGGSIAGLMHALVLKSLGRNVLLLEAQRHEDLQARAAGLTLWPHAQKFINMYAPEIDLDTLAFRNRRMQVKTGDGMTVAEAPVSEDVRTSSWAVVHQALLRACEKPSDKGGRVSFEYGKRVCGIEEQGDNMVVTCKGTDGVEMMKTADLVIAADGARSFVRSQVLPTAASQYTGYLLWRGCLQEEQGPPEFAGVLEGKLATFMFGTGYILVYLAPGETGSTTPGERLFEWCWYDTCDASSSTFSGFMTDKNGNRHANTVPTSLLRPEAWQTQLERRKDVITPLWHSLFAMSTKSSLPQLTAIHSFDNTKASFFNEKLWLAGEAFIQIRPHLGSSCSIPALQALTMAWVLKGEMAWDEAHQAVVEYAIKQAIASKATGVFGMTGEWPEGYVPLFAGS